MSTLNRINRNSKVLWTIQALLAALFLFAGITKFTMPVEMLEQSGMSVEFLRFIGVAEVAGALGLILPGLFRVQVNLTPLAALGLAIIMVGAVVTTAVTAAVSAAIVPAMVGGLLSFVVAGRWQQLSFAAR
jgi:hypothetical protein